MMLNNDVNLLYNKVGELKKLICLLTTICKLIEYVTKNIKNKTIYYKTCIQCITQKRNILSIKSIKIM